MKLSPERSPTSNIFGYSGVSVSFSKRVLVCLNLSLKQMRAYLLVMLQTPTRIESTTSPPDLLKNLVTWSLMNIMAPKWGQSDLIVVDDEISPQAIRRIGVGQILPIEEPLVVEGERQCSTHVEPSPPQDQQANQEQDEGPPSTEQDQGQDQIIDDGSIPNDDQDQVLDQGQAQDDEQVLDGAQTPEVDSHEASQESLEEARADLASKIASKLSSQYHSVDQVLGSLRKGVTTRSQLRNFCAHNAFVSCIEPQKVFEALEDPDWLEAMHE